MFQNHSSPIHGQQSYIIVVFSSVCVGGGGRGGWEINVLLCIYNILLRYYCNGSWYVNEEFTIAK